jgi:hypothetical protein
MTQEVSGNGKKPNKTQVVRGLGKLGTTGTALRSEILRPAHRPRPKTGGFYWFPLPVGAALAWDVLTCHELGLDAEVGHVDLWPFVIDRLAKAWNKDARVLRRLLSTHCYGLPRGRVTRPPKRVSVIHHGNDAPRADWLERVILRFDLERHSAKPLFDEHETTFAAHRRKVMGALGIPFDGNVS